MDNEDLRGADRIITANQVLFFGHDLATLFRRVADYLEDSSISDVYVNVERANEDGDFRICLTL